MSQIEGHTVEPEAERLIEGYAQHAIIHGSSDAVHALALFARQLQVGLQLERKRAENDGRARALMQQERDAALAELERLRADLLWAMSLLDSHPNRQVRTECARIYELLGIAGYAGHKRE